MARVNILAYLVKFPLFRALHFCAFLLSYHAWEARFGFLAHHQYTPPFLISTSPCYLLHDADRMASENPAFELITPVCSLRMLGSRKRCRQNETVVSCTAVQIERVILYTTKSEWAPDHTMCKFEASRSIYGLTALDIRTWLA